MAWQDPNTLVLTVGDRQRSLRGTLTIPVEPPTTPPTEIPATLTSVVLRMVLAKNPNTVKINNVAVVIEGPGVVRYDWSAADVDTAELYYYWFIDTDVGGRKQTWPDNGRTRSIEWVNAA
jgi:hypothetical protein